MARNERWIEEADGLDIARGLVAGVIGGLAGAWMMNQYHTLVSKLQKNGYQQEDQGGREAPGQEIGSNEHDLRSARELAHERLGKEGESDSEPATQKAAAAVVTGMFGHQMNTNEKQLAGSATHYAFGASMGAVYGALAEASPAARVGLGLPYGAGVWLAADEIAVPALGLAKPPQEHPVSTHVNALAAHLVYGLTLEVVRRLVRRML